MSKNSAKDFQNFNAFWIHYLSEHADPRTRIAHYCGTVGACLLLLAAVATMSPWLVLAAPIVGYGPAWAAHSLIEHNRPATFTYPLWSFLADFRMLFLAATGELRAELERLGFD